MPHSEHSQHLPPHNSSDSVTLKTVLDSMAAMMATMARNHDDLSSKLSVTNGKIDSMVCELSEKISTINNDLNSKISGLREEVDTKFNAVVLRAEAAENNLDRFKRLGNLLVLGVPFEGETDVSIVFRRICSKIKFDIKDLHYEVFRMGANRALTQNKPPAILLKLGDYAHSKRFLDAFLHHQPSITTADIGFSDTTPQRIHVVRSLTKLDQEIRNKCVELKKAGIIHQVATYESGISVKISQTSSNVVISSVASLAALVAKLDETSAGASSKRKRSSPTASTQPNKLSAPN